MAIQIKTPQNAWSTQRVTLEDVTSLITLRWMDRESVWVIDIFDTDNTPILTGIKLTENVSITKRYVNDQFKLGDLWVLRFSTTESSISRTNLGTSFKLVYLTKEEGDATGI